MAVATATKQDGKSTDPKHNVKGARQAFYDKIAKHSMAPLWERMHAVVGNEPVSKASPVVWHFDQVKSLVMEAGDVITAEEATRRVLILENPSLPGQSRATNTLFAGIQMILPGEIAPAHRHAASAIRFVLDGEGAYTAVDGEKAIMAPGDFVITGSWCFHDHGNTSDQPMLWLDVLDVPTVNHFETSFAEEFEDKAQHTKRQDGDSIAFYGSGVLPDGKPINPKVTPIINYTYARMRPILERLKKAGDIDKRHGARLRYANPTTGGPVLATMGAQLSLFPKGFKGEPYRATDGMIFACAEGGGRTKVGDEVLEWGPWDVFVVPPWKRYSHTMDKESVLFSISDRPAQEALGIFREDTAA